MLQKNQQKPRPPVYDPSGPLAVHSIFPTLQGEGPFAGERAVFIRLAHCNLQCPGCDTEYTEGAQEEMPSAIAAKAAHLGPGYTLAVITGGEPLRQDIRDLVWHLEGYGFQVQIETNGVLFPYDLPSATIVVSPKTHRVHKDLASRANAYKYVVQAGDVDLTDGLPIHALNHKVNTRVARPPEGFKGLVYVQPMDEQDPARNERNTQAAVDSVLAHGYVLCLQMHKYVGVE